jgi:hypothetical protein
VEIGIPIASVVIVRGVFTFPDPVDETSARLVAAGVVVQVVAFLALREGWLLVPLAYGFVARVSAGPTLSPLGQLVTRVVSPRVPGAHRRVPGPPKRFAQGIGATFSTTAAVAWLFGATGVSVVLSGALLAAAALEAVFAVCLGCIVHQRIWGCEDCGDLSERLAAARATS